MVGSGRRGRSGFGRDKLKAAGVEPRIILFARADREGAAQSTAAERATVAELWLTRDWSLYQRWIQTPAREWTAAGIPAADGNLARAAVVEASRQFDARLTELLKDAGVQITYPLVLWRDRDGFLKACGCADSRAWPFIRDDLNAPDRVGTATPDADAASAPYGGETPAPGSDPSALPYPNLPAIPPANAAPGAAPQAPGAATPGAQGTAPNGQATDRTPPPRAAPTPKTQDDSTFF